MLEYMLRNNASIALIFLAMHAVAVATAAPSEHTFDFVSLSPNGERVASVEIDRSFDSPAAPHGPIVIRATARGSVLQRLDPCEHCTYAGLTWSADSTALVFIATDDSTGKARLELARGSQLQTLAAIDGVASFPRFSPDGRRIALLATVSAKKRTGALEAGAPQTGDIGTESDEQRLATVPVQGGELTFASPADTFVYEYDWTPDSRGFVGIAAKGDGDANWWIAELDAFDCACQGAGKGASRNARLIAHFDLQMAVPRVAPDGRSVQFIGGLMSDAGTVGGEIYEVPIEGGTPHSLTPGYGGSFTSIAWKGSKLYATAILVDHATLNVVGPRDHEVQTLWSAPVTARAGDGDTGVEVSLSGDGKKFATAAEDFAHGPAILFGTSARPTAITHDNDERAASVDTKSLRWHSDNYNVQGWLACPPTGADSKPGGGRPLIVHVHGGPSAAILPLFGTDYSLYTTVHEWTQRGYCVLLPNPRGSYGQGDAYTRANVRDFGGGDFRDILAGVDAAVANAPIDPKRVGIHGHSYGGFMTMWAVTHTTRFAAAIAGAGLSNWISYYGTNGIDTWMLPFFGASMYDNPQIYRDVSPLETIRAARTPTLLYTGDLDVEVPETQSFEFWRGLRAVGVTTELHVYPGEGHLLQKPEHVLDLRQRLPAWFERYLKQ
jgi:dipeptidyl aminopeptidase/acylaminoacyl peptidase